MLVLLFAVVVAICALTLALKQIKACGGITPFAAFLIVAVALVDIGFIVLYIRTPDTDRNSLPVLNVALGTAAAMAGGIIGGLCRSQSARKSLADETINLDPKRTLVAATILFCIVLFPYIYVGNMPLISAIKELFSSGLSGNMLNEFRNQHDPYLNPDATRLPLQGLFDELRYIGIDFFAVYAFRFWQLRIKTKPSLAVLLFTGFLLLANGQRWPLLYLLVTITIYGSWGERQPRLGSRRLHPAGLLIVGAGVGVFISMLLGRNTSGNVSIIEGIQAGISDLWERLLVGDADVPFAAYSVFPFSVDFLHGASYLLNVWAYVPGHPLPSFPVIFNRLVTGDLKNFTAAPDFFTEAYVNFGVPGTVLTSLIWGFVLSKMTKKVIACRTLLGNGVWAVATMLAASSCVGGLTWFIGLFIDLIVVWTILRLVGAIRRIPAEGRPQFTMSASFSV